MDSARAASAKKARNSPPSGSKEVSCPAEAQAERSVWVAVRARPLVSREHLEGAKACISVNKAAGSVRLGSWRQYTYDHAFGPEAQQQDVFVGCVSSLVGSVFEGYNATVLAYGPTGSGKTHTMGMGSALHSMTEHHGIIPRVIKQLFDAIAAAPSSTSYVVKAQFLEIYNEELRDLLGGMHKGAGALSTLPAAGSSSPPHQRSIAIRECPDGQIVVTGAREVTAGNAEDLLKLLDVGTLTRATSGTLLNEQSSRSHAIFSIALEQSITTTSPCSPSSSNRSSSAAASSTALTSTAASSSPGNEPSRNDRTLPVQGNTDSRQDECITDAAAGSSRAGEDSAAVIRAEASGPVLVEYRCSKFHLVDLAGSERASRSGAAGVRFKETVNINQGLLALGNVISALSDGERRTRHVPYRDSKLTRLLQDSLGGNSKTLMIACVSSADDAVEESLNTLKYAARARSIRNRPVVNRQCLGEGPRDVTVEIQALQLAMLRRLAQQLLGVSSAPLLPELLLTDALDAAGSGSPGSHADASHKCMRMLQELQAMAASSWPLQLSVGSSTSSDRQQGPTSFSVVAQQLAELESRLLSANKHIDLLELGLDVCAAEQQAVQQAAGMLQEQQAAAWAELLQEMQQLHVNKQLSDVARQHLQQLAQKHQQQVEGLCAPTALTEVVQCGSLHSYPLPEEQSSSHDQLSGGASAAYGPVGTADPVQQEYSAGRQPKACTLDAKKQQHIEQKLADLQIELAEKTALLQVAQGDLTRDEQLSAAKVKEVERLQADLAAAADIAQRREEAMAVQLRHAQADVRRWRARALAVQNRNPSGMQQEQHALPPPPQSPPAWQQSPPASPSALTGLQQEVSFATLPRQQRRSAAQPTATHAASMLAVSAAEQQRQQEDTNGTQGPGVRGSLPQLQLYASTELSSEDLRSAAVSKLGGSTDDEVLFDAELASYISDTDYTDLHCADFEADSHLLAELQVVLADKAALEEEKAAAQAEAAAAQRAFEHSRAMLEGQLSQLSSAINSQEALIATLQANEAEAKNLGALYLERCRELEAQLADLSMDLQELTSALSRVEADVAASADEKQLLRREYERKIEAVVKQMAGLQQQMQQQDSARVEKERQRASSRVQQLQTELSSMRTQQDGLRKRLQDRLVVQEKAAAAKAREMSALRRAAEAARKRMMELEDENRRQRAALKARSNEAATAQRQLRELASRVSPVHNRPSLPPGASPRASSCKVTALSSPRTSASAASPRTPSRTSPHMSPSRCRTDSPQHQQRCDGPGYATSHAGRAATQEQPGSSSPQQKPTTGSGALQIAGAAAHAGAISGVASSSSSSNCKQMLMNHVQLLVSEYLAKIRLKQLRTKKEAVQERRDQLLADKAQLELQQLRRWQSDGNTALATRGSSNQNACTSDPTEQVLMSDLTDQLDTSEAQLQHLEQLMRKTAAEGAAAAEAAAQLLQAATSMSKQQLQDLLGLALKELALQAAECQETVHQAKRLQVELTEAQQQLHETTCCLQMVQLQQQTQLSQLQREHECRVMRLLRNAPGAGPTADQGHDTQGLEAGTGCGQDVAVRGVSAAVAGQGMGIRESTQSQQSSNRLMTLLALLAQQGTEEQRQKLLNTLNRLQQLQAAQQQQQQQEAQQQQHSRYHANQLHRLKQCRAQQQLEQLRKQEGLLSPRLQQQQQQHAPEHTAAHQRQPQQAHVSLLSTQLQLPEQMGALSTCQQQQQQQRVVLSPRAQQQQQQQAGSLSPRPQQQQTRQTGPRPYPQQQQQRCSSLSLRSQQRRLQQDRPLSPRPQQQHLQQTQPPQQMGLLSPCQLQPPPQHGTQPQLQPPADPQAAATGTSAVMVTSCDGCSTGHSLTTASNSCDSSSNGGDSGASSPEHREGIVVRCTSIQAAASDQAGSLRASASRLQAKLCSYRPSLSATSSRNRDGSNSSCGQLRSSSTVLIGSPRASLGAAAPGAAEASTVAQRSSLLSNSSSMRMSRVRAAYVDEEAGAGPAAAMLRKAAQLAMRSSVEASRGPNSSCVPRQQLPFAEGADAAEAAARCSTSSDGDMGHSTDGAVKQDPEKPCRFLGYNNNSSSSARVPNGGLRCSGSSTDIPVVLVGCAVSRLSSSGSFGSINRGTLQSVMGSSGEGNLQSPVAAVSFSGGQAGQVTRPAFSGYEQHRRTDDCPKPPFVDVSCSPVQQQQQLSSSSSGSSRIARSPYPGPAFVGIARAAAAAGDEELDTLPGSAAASPGKDTDKAAVSCSIFNPAAAAAVAATMAARPGVIGSPPASQIRSPNVAVAGACRSPYQQFKASAAAAAAAAAAAGKDQQQMTPGSKSRRGMPASTPSSYMKLLQGLDQT